MKHLLLLCFLFSAFLAVEGFGYVAVANRGEFTVTFINEETDSIGRILDTREGRDPAPELDPEVMYPIVVGDYLFVGDRRNAEVIVFDIPSNLTVAGTVPCGNGIFHMYNSHDGTQFWVVNDLDDTITVFDPSAPPFPVIHNISLPADCCFNGPASPKPHDVVFHPNNEWAYISIFGVAGASDLILKYDINTYEEIGRAEVGKSPHLGLILSATSDTVWPIFAPSQGSLIDSLAVVDPDTMERVDTLIGIAGAHGIYGPSADSRTWYVTNLPGQGFDGVFAFDGVSREILLEATIDTPHGVPHNLAMNSAGTRLYLTHSGSNVEVTIWEIGDPTDPRPKFVTEVDSGLNAYGLQYFEADIDLGGQSNSCSSLSSFLAPLLALF